MPYPDVSVEGKPVADDRAFAPDVAIRRGFSAESPALVDVELAHALRVVARSGGPHRSSTRATAGAARRTKR